MLPQTLPTCPRCNQTDQIQKVTSVYGANTKEWVETHSRTNSEGNQESYEERHEAHTRLGLKLSPPKQPAGPTHPGLWYGLIGFIVLVLGSILCPLVLIPFSLIFPLVFSSTYIPDVAGVPNWTILVGVFGVGALCVGGVGLALVVWSGLIVKRRFDRDLAAYKDKKAGYERDDLPRWQRAQARWEQLYYCLRDETVFIPAENRAITADDMQTYIYDPSFRG